MDWHIFWRGVLIYLFVGAVVDFHLYASLWRKQHRSGGWESMQTDIQIPLITIVAWPIFLGIQFVQMVRERKVDRDRHA